jgi:hypothetical protein
VAASHLARRGLKVGVHWLGSPDTCSDDTHAAWQQARQTTVEWLSLHATPSLTTEDVVIDALLGLGQRARGDADTTPLQQLLQRSYASAGHSIAVQNFNENLSILMMTGLYYLMIRIDLSIYWVITLFGVFVSASMFLVKHRHEANQRQHDDDAFPGDRRCFRSDGSACGCHNRRHQVHPHHPLTGTTRRLVNMQPTVVRHPKVRPYCPIVV